MSDKVLEECRKRTYELVDPIVEFKRTKVDDKQARVHRRNCALLMMYSGNGYYGMQRNTGFPTIESVLEEALHKANLLTDEEFKDPWKAHFQRASKTDKNVSAIGQVCSIKIPFVPGLKEKINNFLPDCIKIIDVMRVTPRFNAKKNCSHRIYYYLLPTFVFSPWTEFKSETCWKYRMSAETLTRLNTILMRYQGTHNFYNFTSRREPTDRSCFRHMMSVECSDPFLLSGDREFAVITVTGQSFMMHQIRKMIGLAIAIVSGYTTEDIFETVYGRERVDIPKAPGLGLMLGSAMFDLYNKRYGSDGMHETIDWSRYQEEMNAFKDVFIYQYIVKTEVEENSMLNWLSELKRSKFDRELPSAPRFCGSAVDCGSVQEIASPNTDALPNEPSGILPPLDDASKDANFILCGSDGLSPHTS